MDPMPNAARAEQEPCASASEDMLAARTGGRILHKWRLQRLFYHSFSADLVAEQTRVSRECAAAEPSAKMWAGDQCANACLDTT